MTTDQINKVLETFPNFNFKLNEPLLKYTTVRLGGPAKLFLQINSILTEEEYQLLKEANSYDNIVRIYENSALLKLFEYLRSHQIKFHILGGGSDTLFSDNEFDGLVIKIASNKNFELKNIHPIESEVAKIFARHHHFEREGRNDLDFKNAYFHEKKEDPVSYFVDAGAMLAALIPLTLMQGLSGLQWFSHIPASIGGAIYNNIHGGEIMFSEYIDKVILLDSEGTVKLVPVSDMGFGYDDSRLQHSSEIVLAALLTLYRQTEGNLNEAKSFVDNWVQQKIKIQPKNYSVGSTFKNITEEERVKHNLPTNSAGYLIDQCGLKGYRIGNAQIYESHGNFFLNLGEATASDYKRLIDTAIEKVQEKFGITLEPEVKIINF